MHIIESCIIAFSFTVFSIVALKPLCIRIGLFDMPGGRKQHQGNIPLVGGIAMFLGFGFALLTLPISLASYRSLLAGSAVLVMLGVLDDLREISPRTRLLGQIGVGLLLTCWGQVEVQQLGNLLFTGNIILHRWALPFTVIAVVGMINAVNMTDGLDGLAGGLSFIEFSFLAGLATQRGVSNDATLIALLLSVIAAFLCFNFPAIFQKRAKIFMGDAGSMLLGGMLTWFLVSLSQAPHALVSPVTMLWVMAVPLFDMVSVMLRRLLRQQSPFRPDRQHLHHLLLGLKYDTRAITFILCACAIVCGMMGVIADKFLVSEGIMFVAFLCLFSVYFIFSHRFWEKHGCAEQLELI